MLSSVRTFFPLNIDTHGCEPLGGVGLDSFSICTKPAVSTPHLCVPTPFLSDNNTPFCLSGKSPPTLLSMPRLPFPSKRLESSPAVNVDTTNVVSNRRDQRAGVTIEHHVGVSHARCIFLVVQGPFSPCDGSKVPEAVPPFAFLSGRKAFFFLAFWPFPVCCFFPPVLIVVACCCVHPSPFCFLKHRPIRAFSL